MTIPSAAFLLLTDSRLPTGGHAHSGGMEEAVSAGRVTGVGDLEGWLLGRLHTVGVVDAAFAAAAHRTGSGGAGEPWLVLDREWAARTVSPALRHAGRAMGRGLLRAARSCWPAPHLRALAEAVPAGAAWPVAMGAVGTAAGCDLGEVTAAAASASISGPAWAATRLLGADPFAVAATLSRLSGAVDAVARAAGGAVPVDLPALSAPLLDLGAERHATWEVRLFAS